MRGRIGASGPGHGTGPGVSSSASRTASSHSCHLRAPPARRPTEPEPQPGPDGSDVTMGQPTPGRACGAPPTGGRGAHAGRLSGLAAAGLGVLWDLGSGGFVSNLDLGSVAPRRLPVRVLGKEQRSPSPGGEEGGRGRGQIPPDRAGSQWVTRWGGSLGRAFSRFLPGKRSSRDGGRTAVLRGRRWGQSPREEARSRPGRRPRSDVAGGGDSAAQVFLWL